MIKKAVLILTVLFFTQVLISCFITCDCDDSRYQINYESVTITPYNTAGFNFEEVVDSVYKNAFGLEIYIISNRVKIGSLTSPDYNLGFNSAMACSCPEPYYYYPDRILNADVFVIDTETGVRTNITNNFGVPTNNSEPIPLQELFTNLPEWFDGFMCELTDFDYIPSSAIFITEVYMESGTIYSDETAQINFYTQTP